MANKEYTVETESGEYTVLLSDEEAKARGLTEKKARTAANKSATPANKSASSKRDEVVAKSFGAKKKSEG